jgi:hypothetical protein
MEQDKKGRWELEIDPAAAWMVRKARFYRDAAPNEIGLEMKNEGAVWSKSRCIPTAAAINVWNSLDSKNPLSQTKRLTFDQSVEPFDEQLYKNAEQSVAHNTDTNLTVHDYHVQPATFTQPIGPSRKPSPHLLP